MNDNRAASHSDANLVAGVAARQPEALQELYTRYSGPAYALAVRMLVDAERAEECMQAVFLAFWREPQSYDPARADFCAWLLAAVHRTARAWQRVPSQGGTHLPPVEIGANTQPAHPAAANRGSAERRLIGQRAQARTAQADLHPAERAALERAFFDGQTAAEIAASLQVPPMTVQMRIRDGIQRLSAAQAGVAYAHGADSATDQPRHHAESSRLMEAFSSTRALADETNPEYRSIVHHAPVRQDSSEAEPPMRESSMARRLDKRQEQLLLTLGHELKTPITAIKGTVQLAHHRLRAGGHEQEAAWLAVANSQIDRLTALVDYLLRAGQLDSSQVELHLAHFNLADLVREVAMTQQTLNQEHTLIVEAPEEVAVEGDADRLRQVVHNLISNAIKYSLGGSRVEITLRRTRDEAELCVRDYGIGIPSEDRTRVFERFERATNVGHIPGFGLGLTMCRDIVQAHHGRLWVGDLSAAATAASLNPGSRPVGDERGSLFCLALPLEQDARS